MAYLLIWLICGTKSLRLFTDHCMVAAIFSAAIKVGKLVLAHGTTGKIDPIFYEGAGQTFSTFCELPLWPQASKPKQRTYRAHWGEGRDAGVDAG